MVKKVKRPRPEVAEEMIAPPKMTPPMGPVAPPAGEVPMGMAPGGMRADLTKDFENLEGMQKGLEQRKTLKRMELEQARSRLVQSLFEMMEDLGVDPSNLDSINNFLQQLQGLDPDLADLFELAFTGLTERAPGAPTSFEMPVAPGATAGPAVEESPGLMDQYSNLAEKVLRKGE